MPLFLAHFINRIDRKGRVSVPAPFRATLAAQNFQGVVLFRSATHPCLEGFDMTTMETLADRLDRFDLFSAEQDDLATAIFGASQALGFDPEGRITVPPDLLAHAQITDQLAFVGLGRKFQVWNPDAFAARKDQALDRIRDQGLTVPGAGSAQERS